jgi:hypothetical protein
MALPIDDKTPCATVLELKNMHKLVEVYDEMENCLQSLLELFRIIESRRINKNDIIDVT